jgi:copper chaperone CopZ
VRSALTGTKGVKSADVSLGKASVTVEKGTKADDLIAAIKKAGYTAKIEKAKK